MAQSQYYEILNDTDKNPEQQFFTNVEDQTLQYVITPDKTQIQFPTQQITQDQILHTHIIKQPIIQQPIIQQPIQIQAPQYAVIKDGTIRTTEGQQIFFVENAVPDSIVIEKAIQHTTQPIVLNHQLAPTVVRGPIMKPVQNQQVSLELIQKQKTMQRSPNPNQVRQMTPQIRQQAGTISKQSTAGTVHSTNISQTQLRPQQPGIRQGLVRTSQTQFRPQQPHNVIRPADSNQGRPLRLPNQTLHHRPSMRTTNMVLNSINPRSQGSIPQQPQTTQKFNNQTANLNETEMKPADDQEAVSLADGTVVTMASYKKMLADQKTRSAPQKQNLNQQNNQLSAPLHQNSPIQTGSNPVQLNAPVQQNNPVQAQNSPGQQQNSLLQQTNLIGNAGPRPQLTGGAKKRNPSPRLPRAQGRGTTRMQRPRATLQINQQPAQQQPSNTPGHFSLLSQQQPVNNKPPPQQFQAQIQMPAPSTLLQQQSQNQQQNQIQQQIPQQSQIQQQVPPQNQIHQQPQLSQQQPHNQQQQPLIQQQQQPLIQQQQARNKPSQANFVIQPPKANQKPAQQRPLPAYFPSSEIQKIIESTPISEEFSDSIRMLVLLENGEQRLITFTLPKEACTIQEILEQVNVPFQNDTHIQVIEINSGGLNYIVTVGNVANLGFMEEEMSLAALEEPQTPPIVHPQGQPQPQLQPQPQTQLPLQPPLQSISQPQPQLQPLSQSQIPSLSQPPPLQQITKPQVSKSAPPNQQKAPDTPPPKSPSPEPVKEAPKYVTGMLALCGACGYLSEDFNKCIRCGRKLPDSVKAIPANVKGNPGQKRDIAAIALAQQQKHQALQQQQQQQQQPQNPSSQQQPKNNPHPAVKVTTSPQKKKSTKTSKPIEESVHVISSDDEEEEKPKLSENLLQKLGNSVTICPISKEPSAIDIQRHCSSKSNSPTKTYAEKDIVRTKLKCRTVRIGSYRCVPLEEILIDTLGVTMKVPHPNKEKGQKTIILEKTDMVKVLASFNSSLPVVFYYLNSSLASKVREELDMTSDSDYYFDPLSLEDEAQRRITLLPDDITEDNRNIFQLIYGFPINILEELNIKEANDILIKTCPKDVARNTPGFGAFAEIKQLLTYPPEGRYRITINTEDYICLAQDQFLNDVIIDFYLTYLVENLSPEMKSKVHVFSTFFYRRLTTKPLKASRKSQPTELDPTLSPAQKRHARVKKWTKNVNIFEKDFIIVPINENAHWFLAIICFPGMNGCHTWDDKPYKLEIKSRKKKKPTTVNIGNVAVTIKQEKLSKSLPCDDPDLSDKDEAEGDDSEMESDDSEELPLSQNGQVTVGSSMSPGNISTTAVTSTPVSSTSGGGNSLSGTPVSSTSAVPTQKMPKEVRPPIKQSCILIFDSLSGASRSRVVATLRDYLTCEYKSKNGKEKTYNKDIIKGASPKVPQQNNFTDCGLYLLQYVEQFFKDPIKDFHIPIKEIQHWFEEITVTKKREDIANLIKSLMKEYGKDLRLVPDIAFPTLNGKIVEREMEEEEEDEEEMMEEEEDEDSFNATRDDSILTLNTSRDSLSEPTSSESDMKSEDTDSPIKPSNANVSSDFVTQTVVNQKPDLCEFPRQTNKDTLSILKAKRIIRHKNIDGPNVKKMKGEQE